MPQLPNLQHERMALAMSNGRNQREAYLEAYHDSTGERTENAGKRAQMMIGRHPEIRERAEEILNEIYVRTLSQWDDSAEQLKNMLFHNALAAGAQGKFSASNKALELLGKTMPGAFAPKQSESRHLEVRATVMSLPNFYEPPAVEGVEQAALPEAEVIDATPGAEEEPQVYTSDTQATAPTTPDPYARKKATQFQKGVSGRFHKPPSKEVLDAIAPRITKPQKPRGTGKGHPKFTPGNRLGVRPKLQLPKSDPFDPFMERAVAATPESPGTSVRIVAPDGSSKVVDVAQDTVLPTVTATAAEGPDTVDLVVGTFMDSGGNQ